MVPLGIASGSVLSGSRLLTDVASGRLGIMHLSPEPLTKKVAPKKDPASECAGNERGVFM